MKYGTPESVGIRSAAIESYLRSLEDAHLAMHNVIIARHDTVVFEHYYKPFYPERRHRLYSETKSFVSLAVGLAVEDGLLTLDDTMEQHFAAELEGIDNDALRRQTVRNMLMMSTIGDVNYWFGGRPADRVRYYFQSPHGKGGRTPGVDFSYDSTGTFVIGSLVERLTGRRLADYLQERLFDKIGIADGAHYLLCPGGHSWSDSAFLMRPRDLVDVGRLLLDGGRHNGEQILPADYVREATSNLISTEKEPGAYSEQGYGYYIWHSYHDGFFFNGMGCQFTACYPKEDIIFVCNADNQGNDKVAGDVIFSGLRDLILNTAGDPMPDDPAAARSLADYADSLELFHAYGAASSPMAAEIDGKTFVLGDNPMGITRFTLRFGETPALSYTNAQGDKVLPFGMCKNCFGAFPQTGYSNEIGSAPGTRLLDDAVSAAWIDERTLWLKIQIIDDYFGNCDARFTFTDDGRVHLSMTKTAEDFLDEYRGEADGAMA